MKKAIFRLLLIIIPAALLFSCKKDNFSEKDALDAQQTIDVAITVVDASVSLAPVPGAIVKMLKDSTLVSKTTNSDGTVVFTDVKIGGDAAVSVTKDQYTSVLKTVYVEPESYRQTKISEVISVYSLESSKVAIFKGRLTMQGDMTDRDREPAVGVEVKARNSYLSSATNELFTAKTDNNGNYSIAVPVSSNGDAIELFYPEFTFNQKLAFVQNDRTIAVAERPVLYKSNDGPTFNIPAIPSIYATIATPSSAGTGFALGSKANRTSLFPNSTATLIDGGSGYNGGVSIADYQFSFSNDPNGVAAKLQVDIVDGKITNIDGIINNGATYSSAPTLDLSSLSPAVPATIMFNFQTTYKIYISNKGTGYSYFPQVNVETESFSSGVKVKSVDVNINDFSNPILGSSAVLSNNAMIYGGLIKSLTNGDTLLTSTNAFSSAPVFTVIQGNVKPAVISVTTGNISLDSTLAAITLNDGGLGFSQTTPPAITLTTLAGYGTGAVAKSTVNSNGTVSAIYITNPGIKYVKNVNDFRKNGTTTDSSDSPSYPNTNFYGVKPGDEFAAGR